MKLYFINSLLFLFCIVNSNAQINVQLLHQLVAENKSENKVQVTAKNRQAEVTANEEVNRSKMAKLKDRYRQLKSRFHTLGLVIGGVQVGLNAVPIVDEIIAQQQVIYNTARDNPLLIPLALETEEDLVNKSRLLLSYLYGLVITLGDINQMKASDRKMLFSHVITELRIISGISKGLAICMVNSNRKIQTNLFAKYINKDKSLVDEIKRKISILKN